MFLLLGLDAGVADSDFYKSIYDDTLEEGEFNQICSYFIELADPPDAMCSGGIYHRHGCLARGPMYESLSQHLSCRDCLQNEFHVLSPFSATI